MVTVLPKEDKWGDIFAGIGQGVSQGYMNRTDEMALQKAVGGLDANATPRQILDAITGTRTYSPESKQNLLKNYLGVAEFEELKRKNTANENIARSKVKQETDTESLKANYLASGMPEYEAELMSNPAVTPATKQQISKQHADLVSRGIRQPIAQAPEQPQVETPPQGTEAAVAVGTELPLPVEEAVAPVIEAAKKGIEPKKQPEWPEVPPPPETTPAEKEKWRTANQKENNKLLKETKAKTNSHTNALIRYNRLNALNNSGQLPSGIGRLVVDQETGEPRSIASLLGLVNKETQDFVKTMNDFLIDAKTYFGSRVTNFDVNAFKSRLPTLLNTDDGRRLIIEQMKLMEDLQITHDKTLEDALKHYGRNASYSDIQKIVDDKTGSKEEQIINKLNNLDKAASYMDLMANNPKYKDTKLMQDPETGKFKAFRLDQVKTAKAKGWTEW